MSNRIQDKLVPTNLRSENMSTPLGIDKQKPLLSWTIQSEKRGARQSAYQIIVASSPKKLEAGKPDLWDSGKVLSESTLAVEYNGKSLESNADCFWKVKAWDGNLESEWSTPSFWSIGLLNDSDWKADWIGFDKIPVKREKSEFEKSKWIWYPEKNIEPDTCRRYFRKKFKIPEGKKIKSSELFITLDDQYLLRINGEEVGNSDGKNDAWRRPGKFDISKLCKPGTNVIDIEARKKLPGPGGLILNLEIKFQKGGKLTVLSDASWSVSKTDPFSNKKRTTWKKAKVEGDFGIDPWGVFYHDPEKNYELPPPRHLRKEFVIKKKIRKAFVHATAFGNYELQINGSKVSDDFFTPGWTDYNKRIYYNTYDVTKFLKKGENAIGAILADGWYSGYVAFKVQRNHYGSTLRLKSQLNIEYSDGTTDVIPTDVSWKGTSNGPFAYSDFLMGECFDARKVMNGWSTPKFNDAEWGKVKSSRPLNPRISSYPCQTVKAIGEIKPVETKKVKPGVFIFDMGQNFAGFVRLKVKGQEAGRKITLRFAERLSPDGTMYVENLRGARPIDTYICSGTDEEIWQPSFTFHGFQYVEISGMKGRPSKNTILGIPLSSDTPEVTTFNCSNKMVNQLYNNIWWTQRMNFIDIPTDCPQRDERLGWTGDAQVYVKTAGMITDVQAFFAKWMVDLTDAQRKDGQFPMVAPLKVAYPDGGPAWADAGIVCPYTIYETYEDKRILETHYKSMTRFIEFCRKRCGEDFLPPKEFLCFGDWLSIKADTPKEVMFSAYFALSTKFMALTSEALGKKADARKFNELFENIKKAFNKAYVSKNGKIKGDTQTAYVLAINYGLLDENKLKLVAKHLVNDIKKRDWHLSTGFVGTKDLMPALDRINRNDVAYKLLLNETFPSWGFSIKHGATSIWERWNGWTPEEGFFNPDMNSFAHYSFGAVWHWMFENIAGIRTDGPGYKKIEIKPSPHSKLKQAKTVYNSVRGRIISEWKVKGKEFHLNIQIPTNTSATVYLPVKKKTDIRESGVIAQDSEGVDFIGFNSGKAIFTVQSGSYSFVTSDCVLAG